MSLGQEGYLVRGPGQVSNITTSTLGNLWPEAKWNMAKGLQAWGGTDLDLNDSHLPAS